MLGSTLAPPVVLSVRVSVVTTPAGVTLRREPPSDTKTFPPLSTAKLPPPQNTADEPVPSTGLPLWTDPARTLTTGGGEVTVIGTLIPIRELGFNPKTW